MTTNTRATKQQKYRRRRADGKICLIVEVAEVPLVESLIGAGFLSPAQQDDRKAVERALERVVDLWCVTSNDAP